MSLMECVMVVAIVCALSVATLAGGSKTAENARKQAEHIQNNEDQIKRVCEIDDPSEAAARLSELMMEGWEPSETP